MSTTSATNTPHSPAPADPPRAAAYLGSVAVLLLSSWAAVEGQTVTRGPYLQVGTPTGVTVRWSTDVPTDSRVWYGPAPGSLDQVVDDGAALALHEVSLAGLNPDTQYFYAVGTSASPLAGDDIQHFFLTAPVVGSPKPTRIWVLGDCGTADANAAAVRDAYTAFTGSRHTDLWLMLGDNAYFSGTDTQYQAAVFDMYPQMLRKSVLWSTRGNHETSASTYYGIFTLPSAGEAGGLASGTEAYYSFDYANVHVMCLDSFGSNRSVGGPMWTWLQSDLAATDQEWLVAFWHHPPYTKGSHNSDVETRLVQMRQNFLPLLEANGVDLVLSGHSHSYERSFLIDGHYGFSSTFTQAMKKDGGDGDPAGDGAYVKGTGANEGAVYCTAGSSGKISGGSLNHPVMVVSLNRLGSVVLDVDDTRMDVAFLDSGGQVADAYTIQRPANPWLDLGFGLAGVNGEPVLTGTGTLQVGVQGSIDLSSAAPTAFSLLFVSLGSVPVPFAGGTLVANPPVAGIPATTLSDGSLPLPFVWPSGVPTGSVVVMQYGILDAAGPSGVALSNGLQVTAP